MKRYKKSNFWFLENDRKTKKEPKHGDSYFNDEWRLIPKFPFLFKVIVHYKLIDNFWVEQPE
ncbi:hypothetical protein [Methanoculleus sp.]|uniref:hypothetical protein n=1 Tax=Methanoculleus sp. TaxID=90427 RepID=UPI0025DAD912|nr:hypothetical protein [Methanoculleus sp.]MCK9319196.1 hypothetical protein [Methanoculleus sp.]